MLVVDTNVLVYAANASSPFHPACRQTLEGWRRGPGAWYATWAILYEFLRVTTHPRVLSPAWSAGQAWSFVESLLASPGFGVLVATARHAAVVAEVLRDVRHLSGNLFHDAHTAVLMGAAEILSAMRSEIAGTVMLIFQPAEEAALPGERSGAELMLEQGVFDKIAKPDAIFGLHTSTGLRAGQFAVRSGPAMASEDNVIVVVRGVGTHASRPWDGVDPIAIAAQMVTQLQTIVSRQVNIARAPAVVSFGRIYGGVHANIISDEVTLEGTIRAFDQDMRVDIQERLTRTVEKIAESFGTTATVSIRPVNPVTVNDPALTTRMRPTLEAVAGRDNVFESELVLGTEDFSNFAMQVPGMYAFMGVVGPRRDTAKAPVNHSAYFQVDDETFVPAVHMMTRLALDYLATAR